MILYKKTFPLGKGVTFFQYITALRKRYFPNFVITIDKIPSTENYRVQIFFVAPLWKWGWANSFRDGVLLRECTIQYSNGERYFTFQVSAKPVNLFIASFQVLSAILIFVFSIFMMISKNTMSLDQLFILAIVTTFLLAPSAFIYRRDKKLLDKVGAIGKELENTQT